MKCKLTLILFFIATSLMAGEKISYSGRLVQASGAPVAGPVNLTFKIYDATNLKCSKDVNAVILTNGVFNAELDLTTTDCSGSTFSSVLSTALSASHDVTIEVEDRTSSKTYPAQKISAVPYALYAANGGTGTASITDGSITMSKLAGSPACSNGQALIANGLGSFLCGDLTVGTVTTVSASLPLIATGTNTVSLSLATVGTAGTYYKVTTDSYGRVTNGIATLSSSDLPNLDASKITTGTLSAGVIPEITASMIGNGAIGNDELAANAVTNAKVAQHSLNLDRLINLSCLTTDVVKSDSLVGFYCSPEVVSASTTPPSGPAGGVLSGTYPNPTIASEVITDAHVALGANISVTKIGNGAINNTEFNRLSGVSSNIQTQLNAKEETLGTSAANKYLNGSKNWVTISSDDLVEGSTNKFYSDAKVLAAVTASLTAKQNAFTLDSTLDWIGADLGIKDQGIIQTKLKGLVGNCGAGQVIKTNADGSFYCGNDNDTGAAAGNWLTDGTNVYRTSGKVGIGTASPTQELEVNGVIKANAFASGTASFTLPNAAGTNGQVLQTNGAGILSWINLPAVLVTSVNTKTGAVVLSTDDVTEGATNKYYTDAKVLSAVTATLANKQDLIAAGTTAQYYRGDKSWQTLDTSIVPENSNLYFTDARAQSALAASLALKQDTLTASLPVSLTGSTISLATNSITGAYLWGNTTCLASEYLTYDIVVGFRCLPLTPAGVGTWSSDGTNIWKVSGNVGIGTASPTQELEVTGVIKAMAFASGTASFTLPSAAGSNGQVLQTNGSGVLSWTTIPSAPVSSVNTKTGAVVLNTDDVTEGATNKYYTDAKVLSAVTATLANKQDLIAAGTTAQYYRGDKSWQTLDTSIVPENGNLYFTEARSLSSTLTGLTQGTGNLVATDTVLSAFGKLMSVPTDYVSKTSNNTLSGGLVINPLTGFISVPSPILGTDAANKDYVDNSTSNLQEQVTSLASGTATNSWTASGTSIYRVNGEVGIGLTSPLTNFHSVASAPKNQSLLLPNLASTSTIYPDNTLNMTTYNSFVNGRTYPANLDYLTINLSATPTNPYFIGRYIYSIVPQTATSGLNASATISALRAFALNDHPSLGGMLYGGQFQAYHRSSGRIGSSYGLTAISGITNNGSQTASIATSIGISGSSSNSTSNGVINNSTAGLFSTINAGTVLNNYGVNINTNNSGTISNNYGLSIQAENYGTISNTNYGLYIKSTNSGTYTNTPFDIYASTSEAYNYLAGSLGIGTATPSAPLHISKSVDGSGGTGVAAIIENTSTSVPSFASLRLKTVDRTWSASIRGDLSSGLAIQDGTAGGAVRLFIDNTGRVGLGTVLPQTAFHIESNETPITLINNSQMPWKLGPDPSNNFTVYTYNGVGAYLSSGSTTWAANSDRRLKKQIEPVENALEKLLQISGVTYRYTTDSDKTPRRVGVIAQDVQKVLPEAVSTNKGFLGVRYPELIPLVINAVKEFHQKFSDQSVKIQILEKQNQKLEKELQDMKRAMCETNPKSKMCKQ